MNSQLLSAIEQICEEKKMKPEQVLEVIEQALAAAYKREYHAKNKNVQVKFDPNTQEMQVFEVRTVVEDMDLEPEEEKEKPEKAIEGETKEDEKPKFNPKTQIMISEAKKINKKIKIGEELRTELPVPKDFGRVAAQTAKQVIIQKFKEIERQTIYDTYKKQEGQVVNGTISRWERNIVLVDLGDVEAILPTYEQIEEERYQPGLKLKFLILAVNQTTRGAEIILSRRASEIVLEIFKQEIPEIANGIVQIKSVAREAGFRTKVAVFTEENNVDPVGSCIGQRGVRIQTIIDALGGEKVDIIEYSSNPSHFIVNAIGSAKVSDLKIDEKEKKAIIMVKPNQISLAIGRGGINVRLASQLTGWTIEVRPEKGAELPVEVATEEIKQEEPAEKQEVAKTEN